MSCNVFEGCVNQNGDFDIMGLVTARDGTGADAPDPKDGKLVKISDLKASPDGIVIRIYDPLSATPSTVLQISTPVISSVMYDTLQTTGVFGRLKRGGNFLFTVSAIWVPNGGKNYFVPVQFTSTGNAVTWGKYFARTKSTVPV